MDDKYLVLDIEIAKVLPEDFEGDLMEHAPLGVTCAATLASDEPEPFIWYGSTNHLSQPFFPYREKMSYDNIATLIMYLQHMVSEGYKIVTWNGLRFDFRVLHDEISHLSWIKPDYYMIMGDHIDMMYHFFCIKGYPLGLDTAAKGMGLAGKTEGMDGVKAPAMWADGHCKEVCEYVAQDVRTTMELFRIVQDKGFLFWVSRRGNAMKVEIPRWLTAHQTSSLPHPNTSWMTNPLKREDFYNWLSS